LCFGISAYCTKWSYLPEQFRNISTWNTSKVTDMSYLFQNYPDFNENINEWNVTKVKDMEHMFSGCTKFDQPLDKWRMPVCINMFRTFMNCKKFNQDINDWDVSGAFNMAYMFENCEAFNRPLDKWVLHRIGVTHYMFKNCIAFNQPLNDWDQYLSNCNTNNMFLDCGISEENKPASLRGIPQINPFQRTSQMQRSRSPLGPPPQGPPSQGPPPRVPPPQHVYRPRSPIGLPQHVPSLTINKWFENQGITTYQSIQPVPLIDSDDASVIIEPTTTVYDPIMMDDVNVYDYLKEDTDNIVIVYLTNLHLVSKTRLMNLCSDSSSVKYNCLTVDRINFDRTIPYLSGRSFGCLCGLIEVSKIKTIIETPEIRVVQILDFIPEQNTLSTVSQTALLVNLKQNAGQLSNEERAIVNASNWVSVSHCQAGQEEKIRDIQKLPTPVFATGGKIKRRNAGKKIKKTKKIIRKIMKKKTKKQ
jgi:hypothetical protein